MSIKETIIVTLPTGELVVVLLARDAEEVKQLYHHLQIDAYQFKKSVAQETNGIEFISAGFKNDKGEIFWEDDLIPVPKWYEQN